MKVGDRIRVKTSYHDADRHGDVGILYDVAGAYKCFRKESGPSHCPVGTALGFLAADLEVIEKTDQELAADYCRLRKESSEIFNQLVSRKCQGEYKNTTGSWAPLLPNTKNVEYRFKKAVQMTKLVEQVVTEEIIL